MIRTKLLTYILLVALLSLSACSSFVQVQKRGLDDRQAASVSSVDSVVIYRDDYSPFNWVAPEPACLSLEVQKTQVYNGTSGLHVKWDKITNNCKWLGIGFGSGNWETRDWVDLVDKSALQFRVRAVKGAFGNLPVAFAFEDNAGVQCYCGFRKEFADGQFTDQRWTTVTIPLSNFKFKGVGFNVERVTQMIIQLEADGDIYLDDIKIIKTGHE